MLKIAAIALLSIPLLLVGVFLSSSCVVVDVRQSDGPRVIVPVPLFVARAALAFAPDEATHIKIPDLDDYADVAEQIIDELLDAPDGVLVEVHDGGEHVLITKVGDRIEIDVDGEEEEVSVRLPLTVVAEILESYSGEDLEIREVLEALSTLSRTELVHVRTEDEEVRISIW
ncbi:MAG: hypothetical protein BMS9Abin37_1375 [Acidobacteriota bacterium]|nr:MAG: hypothetical protein BMS9Abin37_1375 [Acidobacteriota bacterium]